MTFNQAPLRVLVVEDEVLLAMDIEAIVEDCGHDIMAEAACIDEVAALPDSPAPHLAFVDIQLARGSSGLDVSALIQQRWADTVIVFVTANPKKIPEDFAGAHGVIPKPFSRNGLTSALHYIEEGVCDPPPTAPVPASFIASPNFAARWR
ncbi:response regulator [Sphingomonas sp. RS2018]